MPDDLIQLLTSAGIALAIALAVGVGVPALALRMVGRWPSVKYLVRRTRVPFLVLALVIAANAVVAANRPRGEGAERWDLVAHVLQVLWIINVAWLVTAIILFIVDGVVHRAGKRMGTRDALRMQTQMHVTRRVLLVLMVVLTVAAVLLTFEGVRAVGAGLLASAGLASVVAALAAQSTLGNLFAGLQLAFSDAVRLDDTVIVEGEYGTIEEITLTYVVVKIWDERRLVLPSTYFTATPFENWTRRDDRITGTVFFDLDWRIDLEGLRAEFHRVVNASDHFNGRSANLVITDASAGYVQVRASVSADDPDAVWFLRLDVRESLVKWLQEHNPEALPQTRVRMLPEPGRATGARQDATTAGAAGNTGGRTGGSITRG
ncbi:mechanosensitive ion channel family protein [Pseudactinotalea sp. Z1732]|uniref:mechanosensitive ion channel family protein n=1 Tax=Micrococcales TaxID=85006 RepID=UPI003C7DD05C